jgi:glucuronate isomerase
MKHVKKFLGENFLLESEAARLLYHQYASSQSILDYHNHLSPKDIAENRAFSNLTELWLDGDHYKWRAMRLNGISEKYCTGSATPLEKFEAWAKTVPYTLRNPLYHWTHLELKRYFGIDKQLTGHSAKEIYNQCNDLLNEKEFRVQSLLSQRGVEVVCTTDDPTDSLEYHEKFRNQNPAFKMYPSFRPDKCYSTDEPEVYNKYLDRLAESSQTEIHTFDDLIEALKKRILFFDLLGCRSSDHGLESLYYDPAALSNAPILFKKIRSNKPLLKGEQLHLQCAVLIELCKLYHEAGWAQQFHLGALRNNNSRMAKTIGADTGFDSIGEFPQAFHLSKFLDYLDSTNQLTRTILYNSNPAHNEIFATMVGNFSDGSEPGKIQFGAGWWFLDQKDGMEKQLNTLSNMGLLSRFVGMVTDSRSFLSFSRHEYFRRVLCNLIGADVEQGLLPDDFDYLGNIVKDICYHNTKRYFRF